MRTHQFTFKKTKRVKTVTEYPAISVDLTKQEAADLAHLLYCGVGGMSRARLTTFDAIHKALREFSSDTAPSWTRDPKAGFVMTKDAK